MSACEDRFWLAVKFGVHEREYHVVDHGGRGAASIAILRLREASRTRAFWLLVFGFFVCGWSTNGLVGLHFIPAAHDHGMPATTAASLLALIGVFDLVGTIDAKLVAAAYGMRHEAVITYLADHVDTARLPNP